MNHVCQHIMSPEQGPKGHHFAHKMSRMTPEAQAALTASLAERKAAMTTCCQLTGDERQTCVDNIRQARYDRVCNNEEPVNIWAMGMRKSSGQQSRCAAVKERCCALTGAERYTCFDTRKSFMG
jgi:hypothetical protein